MIIADITKNRTLFFILLAFLAIISAFTSDLYLPAMPRIAESYQVGHDLIELTITVYMLGLTIGLFVYGNLLDVIGRKPVLIIGSSIYVIGTILCIMSSNLNMLLIGRFIQSLGTSCAIVSWQSIAADVYKKDAPQHMPILFALIAVSPSLGPIIGGLITTYYGWHRNFDAMLILSLIFFICVVFFLPETGTRKHESEVSHLVKAVQILGNSNFFPYKKRQKLGLKNF